MANQRTEGDGSSNTAIVAIVVLVIVGLIVFFLFLQPADNGDQPVDEPDVELNVEPPDDPDTDGEEL